MMKKKKQQPVNHIKPSDNDYVKCFNLHLVKEKKNPVKALRKFQELKDLKVPYPIFKS